MEGELAPEGVEEVEEYRAVAWDGQTVLFLYFCFYCLMHFLLIGWGEGKRRALLGSDRLIWDRIWIFCKSLLPLPWAFGLQEEGYQI